MANMSELSLVLDDLATCTQALIDAADGLFKAVNALRGMYSGENTEAEDSKKAEPMQPVVEEPAKPEKVYEFSEVRKILAGVAAKGRDYSAKVKELLTRYGAAKLSDIKPENYAEIVHDAEVIENA